jgi:putative hydrolase of the HAD superfamily
LIKAVFFDLDNTLTDFMLMKEKAVAGAVEAMIDAGLKLDPDTARVRIEAVYEREGIEFQQVFDHFLTEELGHIDHKLLAAGIVGYRRGREDALVLYPHVRHTLSELAKRGIQLAVVSDAPSLQAWLRLCSLGLHHIFDTVITYDDTHQRKPSPAPFRKALRELALEAHEVLMVGDWPERDMVGAAKVGIPTVYARYGGTPTSAGSEADYVIDDVIEVLDIVERHSRKLARAAGGGKAGGGKAGGGTTGGGKTGGGPARAGRASSGKAGAGTGGSGKSGGKGGNGKGGGKPGRGDRPRNGKGSGGQADNGKGRGKRPRRSS